MPLQARVQSNVYGKVSNQAAMGILTWEGQRGNTREIADGVGAGAATKVFSSQRTLAASASENIDLSGTLADPTNTTVVFTGVKALYIKAADTNVNDVVIGNAATNAWVGPFGAAAHTLALKPGEELLITNFTAAGWPVTAGTGDLLKVLNGGAGTPVGYEIVVIGI